ncbi:hypothetical protein HUA76_44750, partial [Myxococcus sp. CA056]|nr:hypothetical protein [Myxococcus sp. CA056]
EAGPSAPDFVAVWYAAYPSTRTPAPDRRDRTSVRRAQPAPTAARMVSRPGASRLPLHQAERNAPDVRSIRSDGTRDGTRRVKDIFPGATSSAPNALLEFKGRIYFAANDGTHGDGTELWTSDGTEAGTVVLKDLGSTPRNLTAL